MRYTYYDSPLGDLLLVGNDSGALTVNARPITVTADDLSRIYGAANPVLTYTVGGEGLVNGDTLSGSLDTAATAASNVGAYTIVQGSLVASANYALSFVPGTLTIDPAPLSITAIFTAAEPVVIDQAWVASMPAPVVPGSCRP